MRPLDEFGDFVQTNQPLATLTWFRLGGAAEFLARPRSADELGRLVARCVAEEIPLRVLSGGSNVLVPDRGVAGVVVHLESPALADLSVSGQTVTAGAAVPLTSLISYTARIGLGGLEVLTGIPGTVGGAIRGNAGNRQDAIGAFVRSVEVFDANGRRAVREQDDLQFGYRWSSLDDPVIIGATLELSPDDVESVVKRMRRTWIIKKEQQPYGHQSSGMIFKDPAADVSARMLIDQAGLRDANVGGAAISERHSNFIVARPGASAADVTALIDLIRTRVHEQLGYELELQLQTW